MTVAHTFSSGGHLSLPNLNCNPRIARSTAPVDLPLPQPAAPQLVNAPPSALLKLCPRTRACLALFAQRPSVLAPTRTTHQLTAHRHSCPEQPPPPHTLTIKTPAPPFTTAPSHETASNKTPPNSPVNPKPRHERDRPPPTRRRQPAMRYRTATKCSERLRSPTAEFYLRIPLDGNAQPTLKLNLHGRLPLAADGPHRFLQRSRAFQ
eukprot:COSAG02_NODE_6058_length_3835_cov_4.573876_4_plen_207_part_00